MRATDFIGHVWSVSILPPGTKAVQELIRKKNLTGISYH